MVTKNNVLLGYDITYPRIPWEVPWLEPTLRVCYGKHQGPYPHFFYWHLAQCKAINEEMKSVSVANVSIVTMKEHLILMSTPSTT